MSVTEEDVRRALDAEEAEEPAYTATEILEKLAQSGAKIHRGRELVVFCMTKERHVLRWLLVLGAKFHAGQRGYKRSQEGPVEWDLYLHVIPVKGEESWWEAAGPFVGKAR